MSPEEIKKWIWGRCHWDGDCLLWDGGVAHGGVPMVRNPNGERTAPARRILMQALGYDLAGMMATTTCEHPLCMAEAHLAALTRKQLQQRSGVKLSHNVVRNAKLAEVARRTCSVLTMEQVREMRASGMTGDQAAAHYGVSRSAAYNVLAGRTWKEYGSNPFHGLGARNG